MGQLSSVPSVTLVYCNQTVGWIKMPVGTEVGLGPGVIVLDGDPAPPRNGAGQPPLFGPCLLWPNSRPSQQLLSSSYSWSDHWQSTSARSKVYIDFYSALSWLISKALRYGTC